MSEKADYLLVNNKLHKFFHRFDPELFNASIVLGDLDKKKEIENDLLSRCVPLTVGNCNHFNVVYEITISQAPKTRRLKYLTKQLSEI